MDKFKTVKTEIAAFEEKMRKVTHKKCAVCRSVSLNLFVSKSRNNCGPICSSCSEAKLFKIEDFPDYLPTWNEGEKVRFDVPQELQDLREGEKLLIQRISPMVPLQHLRYGQVATRGHCCSFFQDISSVCDDLPRKSVDAILVRKFWREEHGTLGQIQFFIRRSKVLKALHWLKEHNIHYAEIQINTTNLDWMGNEQEALLPNIVIEDGKPDNSIFPCSWKFSDIVL